MTRHPSSTLSLAARILRGTVLLAVATQALAPMLCAGPAATRAPLHSRLTNALFPRSQPGYIPVLGSPALRIGTPPSPQPIQPPPVVLYAPPPPPAPKTEQTVVAAADAGPQKPQPTAEVKPPPLRPEDFLPYFQLDDGASRRVTPEGLQFTPARPTLQTSRAEYRQQ